MQEHQESKHILTLDNTLRLLKLHSDGIKELIDPCYIGKISSLLNTDSDEDDKTDIGEAIFLLKQHLEEQQIKVHPKFLVFDDSPDFNFPDHLETFEYWDIPLSKLCYEQSLNEISNTNVYDLSTLMDYLDNLNTKNMMIKTMYILMFTSKSTTMFCTSLIKDINIIKRMRELYQPFVIGAYDRVKNFYQLESQCIYQLCIIFDISIEKLLMDNTQIDVIGTYLPLVLKYFSEALRCASYNVAFHWIDNSADIIIYLLKEICTHDNVDVYKYAIKYCWENLIFADDDFTRKQKQIQNKNDIDERYWNLEIKYFDEIKPLCTIDEHCLTFGSKNIALYVYENILDKSLLLTKLIKMRYYLTIQYLYDNCENGFETGSGTGTKEQFVICMKEAIDCIFSTDYGMYSYLKYDSSVNDDSNNKSDFFTKTMLDYVNENVSECKTGVNKPNFSIEKQMEICMYCSLNDRFKELVENNPNVLNHTLCADLIVRSLARDNMFCINIITKIVKNSGIGLTFGKEHLDIFCNKNIQLFVRENERMITNVRALFDNGIFDENFVFDIILGLPANSDHIYFHTRIFNPCHPTYEYIASNVQNEVNFLKKALEKFNESIVYSIGKDNPYIFIENYDFLRKAMPSRGNPRINDMYKIIVRGQNDIDEFDIGLFNDPMWTNDENQEVNMIEEI